jgi:nucleoside-diphosphate-sugar epimerase
MIASSIIAALHHEPIIVFGDGEQSSDFVFIDDVVEACLGAVRESAVGQVCDIGTGISTPVKKVAELIIELTQSKSPIDFLPMRTGEVKLHSQADLSNARKYLEWEPKMELREGLKKSIPYYANLLGVKSPV